MEFESNEIKSGCGGESMRIITLFMKALTFSCVGTTGFEIFLRSIFLDNSVIRTIQIDYRERYTNIDKLF